MRHVADLIANFVEFVCAKNRETPARWVVQSGQRSQQCSLSCAVVPEDGVELSASELCGDAAEGRESSELLNQVVDSDDGNVVSQSDSILNGGFR